MDHIFPYLSKPNLFLLHISFSGMLNSFLLCRNQTQKIRDICLVFWDVSMSFSFWERMRGWRHIMLYWVCFYVQYTQPPWWLCFWTKVWNNQNRLQKSFVFEFLVRLSIEKMLQKSIIWPKYWVLFLISRWVC